MNRFPKKSREGGFSLIEVLLTILATTAFLIGTLQLTVVAAWYKVLTKQQANANLWIQADIEEVQALAANLTQDDTLCKISGTPNYASTLQNQIIISTTLPGSTTKALLGGSNNKLYQMNRSYSQKSTNSLQITYTVTDTSTNRDINDSGKIIAQSTVVVIPAASFKCP